MTSIYRYQKVTDEFTTYRMAEPRDDSGNSLAIELCTLADGYTYVSVADAAVLPDQPSEITVEPVTLDSMTRESIKSFSPHVKLIEKRMQDMIRDVYSLEDELYLARISVGVLQGTYTLQDGEDVILNDYQSYVESVREWGGVERSKLGL